MLRTINQSMFFISVCAIFYPYFRNAIKPTKIIFAGWCCCFKMGVFVCVRDFFHYFCKTIEILHADIMQIPSIYSLTKKILFQFAFLYFDVYFPKSWFLNRKFCFNVCTIEINNEFQVLYI